VSISASRDSRSGAKPGHPAGSRSQVLENNAVYYILVERAPALTLLVHFDLVSRCSLASSEACLRSEQLIADCPMFPCYLCSHCFPPVCCLIGVASHRLSTAIDYEST
jgi:hypothetical protein